MNVQLYALRQLERTFTLGGNPYEDLKAREMLINLGVVYWRDENHSQGIVLNKEYNTTCFYSQVIINEDDFSVDEWTDEVLNIAKLNINQDIEIPTNDSEKVSTEQELTINRKSSSILDGKAWTVFNQIRTVLSITPTEVRTVG